MLKISEGKICINLRYIYTIFFQLPNRIWISLLMILCEFVMIGVDIFIGSFVFTSESLSLSKGIVSKVHFHVNSMK